MGVKASKKSYRNTFRSYAKWDYHPALLTHDALRFTAHEISNFKRNHQSITEESSISKNVITIQELIRNQLQTKRIPSNLQLVLIDQNDLQNIHQIGKGNFGTVYSALYKGTRDVALKTLNEVPNLIHEAYVMTCLQHENLLRIFGVTFFGEEKQLSLVMDFMKNGSLLDYLRNNRELFQRLNSNEIIIKLNSFAEQIFQAMLYLEQKSIIHRDLAARNCLIGENDNLKVADFGLTRLTESGSYKGNAKTIFALRWSAPEVIFSQNYSSRSDVWSYGITIWEIYSLGETPFGNINNIIIRNILKKSSENLSAYLPQSTQFGSETIYTHIILPCLIYHVNLRPRFRDLVDKIRHILSTNKQHVIYYLKV